MKIGDICETAVWLTGEENEALRQRYEHDARSFINEICQYKGFINGPVKFIEKKPGDNRVPRVPEHVHGPRVRLLVAESPVVAELLIYQGFIVNLETKDLKRLRQITRQAHVRRFPKAEALTDIECDELIEQLGPETAIAKLREVVH